MAGSNKIVGIERSRPAMELEPADRTSWLLFDGCLGGARTGKKAGEALRYADAMRANAEGGS
jgi:hypothetical protein